MSSVLINITSSFLQNDVLNMKGTCSFFRYKIIYYIFLINGGWTSYNISLSRLLRCMCTTVHIILMYFEMHTMLSHFSRKLWIFFVCIYEWNKISSVRRTVFFYCYWYLRKRNKNYKITVNANFLYLGSSYTLKR